MGDMAGVSAPLGFWDPAGLASTNPAGQRLSTAAFACLHHWGCLLRRHFTQSSMLGMMANLFRLRQVTSRPRQRRTSGQHSGLWLLAMNLLPHSLTMMARRSLTTASTLSA